MVNVPYRMKLVFAQCYLFYKTFIVLNPVVDNGLGLQVEVIN